MKQPLITLKKILITGVVAFMLLLAIIYPYRGKVISNIKALLGYHLSPSLGGSGACIGCHKLFPDKVKTHQKAYVREGISHQKNYTGIKDLAKKGKLIEIRSTKLYKVRSLQYSVPYLLPKGHVFIEELAGRYEKKCIKASLNYVPFTISSVTRSVESVKRLGAVNSNSIKNSAHLKGKTFDISYLAFNNNHRQNEAFISALSEMRMQGRCYVKFERNGCLHITVI